MKRILPQILFSVLLGYSAHATIRTVNNNPLSVAQFSDLNAAINASAVNDTILLAPSATAYSMGSTQAQKRLYFIGAGFAPVYNANASRISTSWVSAASTFEGILFTSGININASGGTFFRCYFASNVDLAANNLVNLTFKGCFFASYLNGSNVVFTNTIISNNIFYSANQVCLVNFNNVNSTNIIFDHNLFYGTNGTTNAFSACRNMIFTNNVFLRLNYSNGIVNSSFAKNLTFNTAGGVPPVWTTNGNSSSLNLFDTSPMYPNMPAINSGTISWAVDYYKLGNTSLGKNYGIDGKDVGLLFESAGAEDFNLVRNSRLPYISAMALDLPSLPVGSNLGDTAQAVKVN